MDLMLASDSMMDLSRKRHTDNTSISGQSVPHVHIHILPRRPQDFDPVDGIYDKLDSVDIQEDFDTMRERAKQPKAKMKLDSERQAVSPLQFGR